MAFPGDYTLLRKIPIDATAVSGSNSDFTGLITEAVFKLSKTFIFANTDNGGGDVRFSTDEAGSNQIAIDLDSWDTSGETCELWYLASGVDDVSPTDLYIWGNNTGDSQPAVGAAFGRNATWVNGVATYLLSSSAVDSTGNFDGTVVGATLQSGGGYEFTGTDRIELPTGLHSDINSDVNILILFTDNNGTGDGHAFDTTVGSSDGYDMRYVSGDRSIEVSKSITSFTINTAITTTSTDHFWVMNYNGSDMFEFYDGVKSSVVTSATAPVNGSTLPKIGNQANNGNPFGSNRIIKRVLIRSAQADDYLDTEFSNQSDVAGFYLEPVDVSTGISITAEAVNANYTSLDPVISLTGLVAITEETVNTNYAALDATVILTGVVSITEQLVNTNYTSLDPIVDLTGLVDITESLVNTNYQAFSPVITLTSGIIAITESLVNTDYVAPNPSILLTPEPIGIVSTVCFNGIIEQLVFNGFIQQLVFNGQVEAIEFNGKIINKQFNGSIQTLIFNGDVKRLEFNGTIQTTC